MRPARAVKAVDDRDIHGDPPSRAEQTIWESSQQRPASSKAEPINGSGCERLGDRSHLE
ncbi:hypothetical protein K6U06_03310 [Acidiferrimicrobium sp. IK]|uniref:hypothetical protein n=1 Tax=Acidiferrimicrobium sp. IK TaxID=2871700 RepID=UPI0021CAFB46|nr:hypothetical protein [Acidiferrimicrobium sp. IK]MCU4183374.1 hypothetical protein [Acidiferrimicrobium sp. IK]